MLSMMPNSLATWTTRFMPICAGHAHGHQVARLLEAVAHRERPEEAAAVVARPPHRLAVARRVFERRVLDDGRGREARIHRREIDERLERRAGLAIGLHRPVELAHAVGPAARHGEHAAGLRVHHHDAAVDVGHLAQRVGLRRIGLGVGPDRRCRAGRWSASRPSRPRRRRRRSRRWPGGRASRRPAGRAGSAAPTASRRTGWCPRRRVREAGRDRGRLRLDLGDDGELPARRAEQRAALRRCGRTPPPSRCLPSRRRSWHRGRASRGGGRRRSGPRAAPGRRSPGWRDRGWSSPSGPIRRGPSRRRPRAGCGGPPRRRSRPHDLGGRALAQGELLGLGRLLLVGGDVAVVAHAVQHVVAPGVGFLLVCARCCSGSAPWAARRGRRSPTSVSWPSEASK